MNENLIIIDKLWFNNFTMKRGEIIGIIVAEDSKSGDINAYIGMGSTGNIDEDTDNILRWGTKIDREVLRAMI